MASAPTDPARDETTVSFRIDYASAYFHDRDPDWGLHPDLPQRGTLVSFASAAELVAFIDAIGATIEAPCLVHPPGHEPHWLDFYHASDADDDAAARLDPQSLRGARWLEVVNARRS